MTNLLTVELGSPRDLAALAFAAAVAAGEQASALDVAPPSRRLFSGAYGHAGDAVRDLIDDVLAGRTPSAKFWVYGGAGAVGRTVKATPLGVALRAAHGYSVDRIASAATGKDAWSVSILGDVAAADRVFHRLVRPDRDTYRYPRWGVWRLRWDGAVVTGFALEALFAAGRLANTLRTDWEPGTPLGVVADKFEADGRHVDAAAVRLWLAGGAQVV